MVEKPEFNHENARGSTAIKLLFLNRSTILFCLSSDPQVWMCVMVEVSKGEIRGVTTRRIYTFFFARSKNVILYKYARCDYNYIKL